MVAARGPRDSQPEGVRIIREYSTHAPDGKIGHWNKGLGSLGADSTAEEVLKLGWNLLREDLGLPSAVLYSHWVEHNLAWMQRFMNAYKIQLAPHGKTTMA